MKLSKLTIVAMATSLAFIAPAVALATPVTDSELSSLSESERAEFQEYLERELVFQDFVEKEPNVVDGTQGRTEDANLNAEDRTSNPVQTADNRIGLLHFSFKPLSSEAWCTANYIGGKFWITAYHCVDRLNRTVGFIEQADGEYAGIENIYVKDSKTDIALIKVGSGIGAEKFSISSSKPKNGDELSINGYGINAGQYFSSKSTIRVSDVDIRVHYPASGHKFENIFEGTITQPLPYITVGGDSGAGVWKNSVLYGVHSGSDKHTKTFEAELASHLPWIEQTMRENSDSSYSEILHAFRGGLATKYDRVIRNKASGSSNIGSSY